MENEYLILEKLSWQARREKSKLGEESLLIELSELCLLSRIHFVNCPVLKISLSVAKDIKGPFIPVERNLTIVSGKKRVLKVGSLPCKFFRVKVGGTIDPKKMRCFGMKHESLKQKFDEDTLELILYNTFSFLYG